MTLAQNKVIRLVVVVLAAVAGVYLVRTVISGRGPFSDPLTRAMTIEMRRQGVTEALEARVRGMTDRAAAQGVGAELGRRGIARLSGQDLRTRAELLLDIDSLAGDTLCAARFMGTLQPASLRAFFIHLDSTRLARWAAVAVTAMKAELEDTTPVAPSTQEEVGAALQHIASYVPAEHQARFTGVIADPAVAPIADQCWASRLISATALAMPEPPQAQVLRTLAMMEAGL